MTLAQLIQNDPRPVGTVLLSALHAADALLRDAEVKVTDAGKEVPVETMTRFIEAIDRAAKLAKVTIDAGVAVKMVEARTRDLEAEGQIVVDAMVSVLDPLIDRLDVAPTMREAWRHWALQSVVAQLHGVPGPAMPAEFLPIEARIVDVGAEVDQDDARS
jgi:hypothetical protein